MKHTLTFALHYDTAGALRYNQTTEDGKAVPAQARLDDALVGKLYLRKSRTQGTPPQLTVTVEY
jgi:hypothetical protein